MKIRKIQTASGDQYHPGSSVTFIEGLKQGDKMNILQFLKNGSGIHIKKKNRGKFTASAKAAGQTVQEHARSVLNDPNATPLQKKRANFARNAAKWKHAKGGKAFVNGVSALDSNPKAYKQVKKKYKMHQFGGYFDTPIINSSPIVGRHLNWLQEASDYATKLENWKREQKLIEQQQKLEQQNRITDSLFGLTNTLLISNIGTKKKSTTNGNPASTGTSSLLTNIGNTGYLSNSQNPMNFFNIN